MVLRDEAYTIVPVVLQLPKIQYLKGTNLAQSAYAQQVDRTSHLHCLHD